MASGRSKDLDRTTAADKLFGNKVFNIAKNSKYDGYQRGTALMTYKLFDKKYSDTNTLGGLVARAHSKTLAMQNKSTIKSEIMSNQQLAEDLHKLIFRKFEKCKVYSYFKHNIWGINLADMELISKFSKVFWFLLYATDIHNKYEWFIHLKDKKVTIITNAFQKILDESKSEGYKPNKIWVDKDSEFSINQYKHGYKIMILEMYSTHN